MAKRAYTKETQSRHRGHRSNRASEQPDSKARTERKDEAGMAIKLLKEIERQYPSNPRKQWEELMDQLDIPALTGVKRDLADSSKKLYRERGHMILSDLRAPEVNIRLQNISEFGKKAAYNLIRYWATAKREKQSDPESASSLANLTTVARRICVWNGLPHAVPKSLPRILRELGLDPGLGERKYVAIVSKAPRARGVDPKTIVEAARQESELFGLLVEGALLFGFREREILEFRPAESDEGQRIRIFRGVKGGNLTRFVEIDIPEQRDWLDRAKAFCARNKHEKGILTFQPMLDIETACKHLKYLCWKINLKKSGDDALGVTFHGLRHQFAQDIYKRESGGYEAPVVTGIPVPQEIDRAARQKVTKALGHHRICVTGAYLGSNAAIPAAARKVLDVLLARFAEDDVADPIRGGGITRLVLAGKAAEGIVDPKDMTLCAWEGCVPSEAAHQEQLLGLIEKTIGTRCCLVPLTDSVMRGETLEVL